MAWEPIWEEIFNQQVWGKYPPVELIRFVARNFYCHSNRKYIRLLEVGCGPGANLWYMAREGFSVYGIDGSETAIKHAKERLNNECLGWSGELTVGDISNIPYSDGYFDGVLDVEAICCNSFEDAQKIYSELARVTKSGGKFFSLTFAKGCWGDKTGENRGRNTWIPAEGPMAGKGITRFTPVDEVNELITGFLIDEVEYITRSMDNCRHEIKELIISGTKI